MDAVYSNHYLLRFKLILDTNICLCKESVRNVSHLLFDCNVFNRQRYSFKLHCIRCGISYSAPLNLFRRKCFFLFYSLLFRDASTSLVISRLESLDVYQKAAYFYCSVVNVSFVKFKSIFLRLISVYVKSLCKL